MRRVRSFRVFKTTGPLLFIGARSVYKQYNLQWLSGFIIKAVTGPKICPVYTAELPELYTSIISDI